MNSFRLPPKRKDTTHEPSIKRRSFICPHCGAHAAQIWYDMYTTGRKGNEVPKILGKNFKIDPTVLNSENYEQKEKVYKFIRRSKNGDLFLEPMPRNRRADFQVVNLHMSRCFACKDFSIWLHDKLIFPVWSLGIEPNEDLPTEIYNDFLEAREIVNTSPRGAAALLRLCIQKLCVELGGKGKNLDADIGTLVQNGLSSKIQRALDVVRVVGNNAVHPGQMDIKDDIETAQLLFGLVNLITEKMLSEPKHVDSLYDSLPEGAIEAIEKRDAKQS